MKNKTLVAALLMAGRGAGWVAAVEQAEELCRECGDDPEADLLELLGKYFSDPHGSAE